MAPRKGMREGCLPSPDWPPTTPNHAHDGWTITTTHRNRAQHIVEALGRREVRQGPSNVRRLLDTQPRDVRAASADWADNTIGKTARRAAAAPAAVLAALVTRRQWWSRPVCPPSADRPAWFRPRHDPGNWRPVQAQVFLGRARAGGYQVSVSTPRRDPAPGLGWEQPKYVLGRQVCRQSRVGRRPLGAHVGCPGTCSREFTFRQRTFTGGDDKALRGNQEAGPFFGEPLCTRRRRGAGEKPRPGKPRVEGHRGYIPYHLSGNAIKKGPEGWAESMSLCGAAHGQEVNTLKVTLTYGSDRQDGYGLSSVQLPGDYLGKPFRIAEFRIIYYQGFHGSAPFTRTEPRRRAARFVGPISVGPY